MNSRRKEKKNCLEGEAGWINSLFSFPSQQKVSQEIEAYLLRAYSSPVKGINQNSGNRILYLYSSA